MKIGKFLYLAGNGSSSVEQATVEFDFFFLGCLFLLLLFAGGSSEIISSVLSSDDDEVLELDVDVFSCGISL